MAKEKSAVQEQVDSKLSPEKLKQLNLAVEALEKQFGKGSIMRLGDDAIVQVQV
ncbi:MAG: DNA recombination/repair protein RecA, partial [Chlorobiales bacterium]|nr:DNA recombination/repair protein RecA [Chlorobiales bacterium]